MRCLPACFNTLCAACISRAHTGWCRPFLSAVFQCVYFVCINLLVLVLTRKASKIDILHFIIPSSIDICSIPTLNYVESSDLAVNRWHLPNDVDLRHKALCAKKLDDVNLRHAALNVLKYSQNFFKSPWWLQKKKKVA